MKTLYLNLRLLLSGDTVVLVMSIWLFLASLANATQWEMLRGFRFCGICTLLLSLTFGSLTGLEASKAGRKKRTIVAALFFLAAVVTCLSQTRISLAPSN